MIFPLKYATATATGTHIRLKLPKAGSEDFAASGDWTPATGDVKISINGGAEANITTLPTYTNGWWQFQLTSGETTGKTISVAIIDSATKAVADNGFICQTFGNASAMYPTDFAVDLPQATQAAVWLALTSGFTTASTVGKLLLDYLNASVAAIKAKTDNLPAAPAATSDVTTVGTAVGAVQTTATAIKAKTDNLPAAPAATGDVTTVGTAVAGVQTTATAIKAKTDNLPAAPAATSDVTTVGTAVAAVKAKTDNLPAAPAATSDVTTVGTAVGAVQTTATAIKAKTDNLPAVPAATADVTTVGTAVAGVQTTATAIKAKTDNLPASPAATGAAMSLTTGERTSVADALLDRADAIETGFSLRAAMRLISAVLTGKLSIVGNTVTIRNMTDTKSRLIAVTNTNGERTTVTTDVT